MNEDNIDKLEKLQQFPSLSKLDKKILNVLEAVEDWIQDRFPLDDASMQLVIAYYDYKPDAFHFKENCDCEDKNNCDVCSTREELESSFNKFREINNE